jgi:hypothetical protein
MFKKVLFSLTFLFFALGSTCHVFAQIRADAGPDQTVLAGGLVTLDGSRSAVPEEALLYYYWQQVDVSGVVVQLLNYESPVCMFAAPLVSEDSPLTLQFRLYLYVNGTEYHDMVQITVEPSMSKPPVAAAGPDQIVFDRVVLDGTQSSDPDGEIVNYLWEVGSDEDLVFANLASGEKVEVGWNLLEPFCGKIVRVRLTVRDESGAESSDSMLLAVVGPVASPASVEPVAEISFKNLHIAQFDRWDKKAVGFYGAIDMPEDLQDLNLDKGDVVDARVTLELFDVPNEGDTLTASGETQLVVKKWRKSLYLELMGQHHRK